MGAREYLGLKRAEFGPAGIRRLCESFFAPPDDSGNGALRKLLVFDNPNVGDAGWGPSRRRSGGGDRRSRR